MTGYFVIGDILFKLKSIMFMITAIAIRSIGLKALAIIFLMFIFCTAFPQDFTRVEDQAGMGHIASSNGVAVADYDKDGDLDVFLVGFKSFDFANPSTWNRLLESKGNGTFEDVTLRAGFTVQFTNTGIKAERGEKMGAAWGDYDNDGYPDLFLTNSRGNELYHNQGNGTFINVTRQAGVMGCNECYSSSGLWWDFDRDRDLDLYVSRINGYNVMYENKGGGIFKDVTRELGLTGAGITWTSIPIDVNDDGFLDLYNVNDTQRNQLFLNNDGKNFQEATGLYGLDDPGAGMGVSVGDYNNDGSFDIYITNIFNHLPNPLFTRLPAGNYRNDAKRLGVDNTGWGWGTCFFDFDNDGDEDIYSVNGIEENQYIFNELQVDVKNVFFKNTLIENGKEGFVDWSAQSGTDVLARGRGLEAFDYDDDGDLDLLVANSLEKPYLFNNQTINGVQPDNRNWIKLGLEGTSSNRDAIGTKIKITANGKSYYRWYTGAAFLDQSLQPVHIGVGSATLIDEIRVKWPSGLAEKISNVPVNQTMHLIEGNNAEVTEPVDSVLVTPRVLSSVRNYPNPFSQSTMFHFIFAEPGTVEIKIISNLGREVFRKKQVHNQGGEFQISWDGRDQNGNYLSGGIYYYIVYSGSSRFNGKILKIGTH